MSQESAISLVIADDEDLIRQGLAEIVSDGQFHTEIAGTAATGTEALALVQTLHPDLAIMDIKMPGIDGLEVIRQAVESGCTTRFLILSGYNDFSFARKAIKYNVKDYFLKPLNIPDFKSALLLQCQDILAERAKREHNDAKLNALVHASRSFFLNRLLQNEILDQDITNEKINQLKLNISPGSCCVAVFSPETEPADSFPDYDEIITECLHPILKTFFYEAWSYKDSQLVCILSISRPREKLAMERILKCLDAIDETLGLRFIAGFGSIVPSLHQCSASYQSALLALSYRIYEPKLSIYDNSILCSQAPAAQSKKIDSAPLTAAILKNNTDEIRNYCDVFFQSLFFVKMPPPNYIRGMCMFLISNVQKDIAIWQGSVNQLPSFTYEDLDTLSSIRHLKDWLKDFFMDYSLQLYHTQSGHDKIIQTAKQYIHDHINRTIKAKDVASEVNLSEAYFAIYFKNHATVNFRDYVLNVKMEHAKNLISSKTMAISEVAYAVGYQDYRSFSRAFKNIVGSTPSEFLNSTGS